jgi:succinoglycan biosynthesis protein ExoM
MREIAGAPRAALPSGLVAATLRTVLIAVPTLGVRPLASLLAELARQAEEVRGTRRAVSLVVIDNSGRHGSSAVRSAAAAFSADYLLVPARGFAQVRNAALEAGRRYDAIVFIDDDEMPAAGWLGALLRGAEHYAADVVTGPVHVRLPAGAPRWLSGGELLRSPPQQPDGPLRGTAASGNTLVRMSVVNRLDLRFDPSFDRSGGEDTAFFTQLARRGATSAWSGAATAYETPDAERLTLSYVMRRAYRSGAIGVLVERAADQPEGGRRAIRLAGRFGRGLFRVARGALGGSLVACAWGLVDLAFVCGWATALLRRRFLTERRSAPPHA